MSYIVTFNQLKEATGYSRISDIERWLNKTGIPFFYGKGGKVFTTQDKINEALTHVEKQQSRIEFD